jgi:hypothetical protein
MASHHVPQTSHQNLGGTLRQLRLAVYHHVFAEKESFITRQVMHVNHSCAMSDFTQSRCGNSLDQNLLIASHSLSLMVERDIDRSVSR